MRCESIPDLDLGDQLLQLLEEQLRAFFKNSGSKFHVWLILAHVVCRSSPICRDNSTDIPDSAAAVNAAENQPVGNAT